jgi:hypothetical protein
MNRTAEDITVQLPLNLSFVLGFNEIRGADESDGKRYLRNVKIAISFAVSFN